MTEVFLEQPLASPGSANNELNHFFFKPPVVTNPYTALFPPPVPLGWHMCLGKGQPESRLLGRLRARGQEEEEDHGGAGPAREEESGAQARQRLQLSGWQARRPCSTASSY